MNEEENQDVNNNVPSIPSNDTSIAPSTSTDASTIQQRELKFIKERFEFYNYVVNTLVKELRRPRDAIIMRKVFNDLQEYFGNTEIRVKTNILEFYKVLIDILKWTVDNQPLNHYRHWFKKSCPRSLVDSTPEDLARRAWTEEKKSYFASEIFPTGMMIFYIGVAEDVAAGWQLRGLEAARKKELDDQIQQLSSMQP